jgi:cytochrome c peroxidase
MKRIQILLAYILLGGFALGGAALGEQPKKTRPIGPLPSVPVPRDNPMSPQKVELGRLLFFDSRLSGNASVSCASCHDPKLGWGDGGDISRGYPGTKHWRNSQTVLNSAYYAKLFWEGSSTSLEGQAEAAATGSVAGNGMPLMMEERLRQVPDYVKRFKEVFGTERPLIGDAWKAIAAFERTIVSKPEGVAFDRYMKGDKAALSEKAKKGLDLFQGKAGCIQCHHGPLFSDEDYHYLGLPENPAFQSDPLLQITLRWQQINKGVPEAIYRKADTDYGLFYQTWRPQDKGKFRTPTLRELVYTPPYTHNGVFFTLEEVVEFYNKGGGPDRFGTKSPLLKPLNLTKEEMEALVAFLEALSSDKPILVDPPKLLDYAVMR